MAVGAGWQFLVALISIACYYVFGLPVGALLGYGFKLGTNGIWLGLLFGCLFQTTVLLIRMVQTNWQKEVNYVSLMKTYVCSVIQRTILQDSVQRMTLAFEFSSS